MKLGDLIGQIERQTGSSITDPLVLDKEVHLLVAGQEVVLDSVDVDGDIIALEE
jgi:hypothetical protein